MAPQTSLNGPEPFAEHRSALLLCGSSVLERLNPRGLLGCCGGRPASKALGGALCLSGCFEGRLMRLLRRGPRRGRRLPVVRQLVDA